LAAAVVQHETFSSRRQGFVPGLGGSGWRWQKHSLADRKGTARGRGAGGGVLTSPAITAAERHVFRGLWGRCRGSGGSRTSPALGGIRKGPLITREGFGGRVS